MLFNSFDYLLLFLPLCVAIYFFLNTISHRAGVGFLVLSSLFFYGWWNPIYLPLIVASIFFNYIVGASLATRRGFGKINRGTLLLTIGIVGNVSLLGYFKYADFFITNANHAFQAGVPILELILPLGISFFTFTQIAYLVDSYKRTAKEYDILNYALFVTFFPHLLAGPIIHHKEMMPQFQDSQNKIINYTNISSGLFLLSAGLFKKVIIADQFGIYATNGFDGSHELNLIEAWATSLSYTFQLYFDFSGYTDMAVGAALFFNIKLPHNFNSPYQALDIQDFWRRWHITLSRFLRDYIYIPLGGNRNGWTKTTENIVITFAIGGFWHGAGWTFIFWGLLHGFAIVICRAWKNSGMALNRMLAWFITFNFVNIGWVFFRAKEWDDAIKVLKGMSGLSGVTFPARLDYFDLLSYCGIKLGNPLAEIGASSALYLQLFGALCIVLILKSASSLSEKYSNTTPGMVFSALLFCAALTHVGGKSEFLYFNF